MKEINWAKLADELSIVSFGNDSESEWIIHELVHVYDCIGEKAFKYVGSETSFSELIEKTYEINSDRFDEEKYDKSEIKISAIVFLVLERLGLSNLSDILKLMKSNLRREWKSKHSDDESKLLFLSFVEDKQCIKSTYNIVDFVSKF